MATAKAQPVHCFEFIGQPPDQLPGTVVLHGNDSFLVDQVLERSYRILGDDGDSAVRPQRLAGSSLKWRDLEAELSTGSLFAVGSSQPVVVTDAGDLISSARGDLEKYVGGENPTSTLFLVTDTWLSNTNLHKMVLKHGLVIDCRPPSTGTRSKSTDLKAITSWIVSWGKSQHQLKLSNDSASLLWDLSQDSFGMVDTSLSKISLLKPAGSDVTPEEIRKFVGGWKADSVWHAVDLALDGRSAEALACLHPIFHAGEHPLSVLAQLSWTLRRYALAYDHYNQARRTPGNRPDMKASLLAAGFRDWSGEVEKAGTRIRTLGRRRLDVLHRWLLDVDLAMKGVHSSESDGRCLIERLLLKLSESSN
jgi:DNA polymerase-3 subunit delta